MWKPALFLITIVLVTPAGRDYLSECSRQASTLLAMDPTYGDLTLAAMGLVVVAVCLLMLCQSPKNPDTEWVWREVRGEAADATPSRLR